MMTTSYEKNIKELQSQNELYQNTLKLIRNLMTDIGESLKNHFVILYDIID